jgi:hypothetical protein
MRFAEKQSRWGQTRTLRPGSSRREASRMHRSAKSRYVKPSFRAAMESIAGKSGAKTGAPKKKNRQTFVGRFLVQRRGLEPPSQLRRQHLKLVCLPVPPPLRMGSDRKGAGVYLRGRGGCKGLASER